MANAHDFLRDAHPRRLYWRLRALLLLLPWQLRGRLERQLLRCKPSPGQLAGHLLSALLATGCASLPPEAARPHSEAIVPQAQSRLVQVAQAVPVPQDALPGASGFRLLADGDHALEARLALVQRAQVSLDVQYYLIAADDTGLRFLAALRDAAARGVRVRLLVDDLAAQQQAGALLAGLAAHRGVELRLFNPLPVRGGAPAARVLLSLHQFERINRRMHNKLLIADGALALTGGRNIADDYFRRGAPSNFIDMDVLAIGPVVAELAALFDRFWNSEQAWPAQALGDAPASAREADAARQAFAAAVARAAGAMPAVSPVDRFGRTPLGTQLDAGALALQFAPVRVLGDAPGKAVPEEGEATARPPAALQGALDAMRAAQGEVLIATPYLVPGPRGLEMLRAALAKRVRVVLMTNALAATDEPLVHHGYARYRAAMVHLGAELHELSPTVGRSAAARGEVGSSLGRLHAKLAVIDRRRLLIGSMNMDFRSMRSNTELGLLIDSPALASEVALSLEHDRDTGTWRLRPGATPQDIEWVARDAGREVVHRREPDAGWGRQFRLGLMSMFVAEEWL